MTRKIPFTKAQVRRAVKAAESAGLCVRGVKIDRDGVITVETGEVPPVASGQDNKALAGSWDDL